MALHIFEERYKLMIRECIDARKPFGIVLIKKGTEALGPLADPHLFGCMAEITQVQRLGEGRLNIGAIGLERIRIITLDRSSPYLVGQVEEYPLQGWVAEDMTKTAEKLRPFIKKYMDELSQFGGVELAQDFIPEEPEKLAYYGAALLQIPAEKKQTLLSTVEAVEFLNELRALYRQELSLVKFMLKTLPKDDSSFSLN